MATGKKVWWPKRGIATIEEFDIPDLGPTEVLLRAECSAFNAGSETAFLYGLPNTPSAVKENAPADEIQSGVRGGWDGLGWCSGDNFFPRAPEAGSIAGLVAEVGSQVKRFNVGDRVQISTWPHASHAVVPEARLKTIPENVTYEESLFAAPAHTALLGVQKAVIQLGEAVAVVGQGQIGIISVQLAKLNGARPVIAIDLSDTRLELAKKCGATHTINPRKCNLEEEVLRITEAEGVRVVIDASGSPEALPGDFRIAGRFGRIVIIGSPRGITKEVNFYPDIAWKNLFIMGAHVSGAAPDIDFYVVPWQFGLWTAKQQRDQIFRLLEGGDLNFKDMAAGTLRMSHREVQEAYRIALEEHDRALNVILNWAA